MGSHPEAAETYQRPHGVTTGLLWGHDLESAIKWAWKHVDSKSILEVVYDPGEGAQLIVEWAAECSWAFSEVIINLGKVPIVSSEYKILSQSNYRLIGEPAQIFSISQKYGTASHANRMIVITAPTLQSGNLLTENTKPAPTIKSAALPQISLDITPLLTETRELQKLFGSILRERIGSQLTSLRLSEVGQIAEGLSFANAFDPNHTLPLILSGETSNLYQVNYALKIMTTSHPTRC